MSVLIKGMEVPESCSECRFFVDAWCYAFDAEDWRNAYNKPPDGERLKDCPLEEPKTGKWILDPNGMDWNIPAWRCSECGYVAPHIGIADKGIGANPMNWAGSKYCPECGCKIVGARMRGEEE